jgi:hypothetical protein
MLLFPFGVSSDAHNSIAVVSGVLPQRAKSKPPSMERPPTKRAGQSFTQQPVLTKRDQVQEKLIEILELQMPKAPF